MDGNGRVTFNGGNGDYTETLGEFTSTLPMICGFWDDLIDSAVTGSGLYYNGMPDRAVFTWLQLAEYGDGGSTTVQIILFPDGRIQFGYNGVTSLDSIVGVSPGPGATLSQVKYSTTPSFRSASGQAVAEQFQVLHPHGTTDPVGSGTVPTGTPEEPFNLDHGFIVWTPNTIGGFDVRVIQQGTPSALASGSSLTLLANGSNPIQSDAGLGAPVLKLDFAFKDPAAAAQAGGVTGNPGGVQLEFNTVAGCTYRVECSVDLATWVVLADHIAGTGEAVAISDPSAARLSKCFYRVVTITPSGQ